MAALPAFSPRVEEGEKCNFSTGQLPPGPPRCLSHQTDKQTNKNRRRWKAPRSARPPLSGLFKEEMEDEEEEGGMQRKQEDDG